MDSKQITCLMEAYSDVYAEPEVNCQYLYDSILNLCIIENYFDTLEECEEFSELLIAEDLVGEFMDEILECYGIDDLQFLNESVEYLGENRVAALRAVVNALSQSGRIKAGLKAGTALGKKPESVVKGSAASTSIRSARAARTPAPAQPQPGKYLARQEFKRSVQKATQTKALPAAGQSTAGSVKAVTQRGVARHKQAMASGQQALDQAKTVASAFMKAMKHGEAKSKLTTAAKGTKGTEVRIAGGSKSTVGPTKSDADTWKKLNKTASKSLDYQLAQNPAPVPAWNKPSAPKMPSTLRKDIRATGPGGDARTQRLASQAGPGSGISPKVSKMTDGASAMNAARRALAGAAAAGVAAGGAAPLVKDIAKKSSPESSVNKYNTMDSDGKIRNRLKVGTKIVGTGSIAGDFDVAFKKARTSGAKEFEFKGKKYTTKLAKESVDTYDLVADILLSEGYVDTYEDALIMMDALDESALARIAAGAIKNVIKTRGSQLSKTKLPPKVDKAFQLVKQSMIKQYGPEAVIGTPQQKYAAARRAAELRKNPPPKPKPRDPYPDDVYSRSDFGIRGYRSGD